MPSSSEVSLEEHPLSPCSFLDQPLELPLLCGLLSLPGLHLPNYLVVEAVAAWSLS